LSRNSGASTSWNPQGLSRPVAGKLYLFLPIGGPQGRNLVKKMLAGLEHRTPLNETPLSVSPLLPIVIDKRQLK
jgi:hypothetical protein